MDASIQIADEVERAEAKSAPPERANAPMGWRPLGYRSSARDVCLSSMTLAALDLHLTDGRYDLPDDLSPARSGPSRTTPTHDRWTDSRAARRPRSAAWPVPVT
ncbi:hypothetical protein MLP_52220 [Microlunatus phosphovorus NM-1]|uniref:Uncharacterized protein n=1 Tax=Microlunatus phosphovorus (strain ATCC 700054 / DSM 10555 / JCM 9379 / NBRC 101784 / NCIMB 13414 / VKM Ac-1990 / NM-1) TaxID=1032480 RepID=F5XIJ8_MICPN|nr:hypothetical protein MLP_52220 [Microlunatus phosphovorus NM-1]